MANDKNKIKNVQHRHEIGWYVSIVAVTYASMLPAAACRQAPRVVSISDSSMLPLARSLCSL